MSGYLAGKVWHSNLDRQLKPIAACLADLGNQDGSGIHPSREFVAWLTGDSLRTVTRVFAKLKAIGVLETDDDGKPTTGRGNWPCYRINIDRLPERDRWRGRYAGQIGQANKFTKKVKLAKRDRKASQTRQESWPKQESSLPMDPSMDPSVDLATTEPPPGSTKTLIDEYHDRFLAKVGHKPKIHGPKDGRIFKDLVEAYGREMVIDCLDVYFKPGIDPFFEQAGYTVGAFSACFNKILILATKLWRAEEPRLAGDERRALIDQIRQKAERRGEEVRQAIVAMAGPVRVALRAAAVQKFYSGSEAGIDDRQIKSSMVQFLIWRFTDGKTTAEVVAQFISELEGV